MADQPRVLLATTRFEVVETTQMARDGKPHGPWWEYVETVPDRETALERARRLAREHQSRIWLAEHERIRRFPSDDTTRRI